MIDAKTEAKKESLPWLPQRKLLPYLFSGLLLCAAIALLQYSFSPLIGAVTQWSTGQISDAIGVLLTISAACTFVTQILVIKKKKLTLLSMYRIGSVLLLVGFALFLTANIWAFGVAMTLAACGAALLVPAYTSSATEQQRDYPGRGSRLHLDVPHHRLRCGVINSGDCNHLRQLSNLSVYYLFRTNSVDCLSRGKSTTGERDKDRLALLSGCLGQSLHNSRP